MTAIIKILGVQRVDFINQENGERVAGYRLWYSTPTKDPAWNGVCVNKAWFPDGHTLCQRVSLMFADTHYEAEFDIRGKKIFDFTPVAVDKRTSDEA